MTINVLRAWRGRDGNRPVIQFRINGTRFSYVGTANVPMIRQYVGGGKVREHRRELSSTDRRYVEIRSEIEAMIVDGRVPFGPPPAV